MPKLGNPPPRPQPLYLSRLPRLRERFYSLPRPDTGAKSTGLGLSFVREIAHLHGGEVTLANRAEGGARSALTLATRVR